MKKNTEKKINWKKVAVIGGVFGLGIILGAIGEKSVIQEMLKRETILLDVEKCMLWGKQGIKFVMRCPKAGVEAPLETTSDLAKEHAEALLKMVDGHVEFAQLVANA